MFPLIRRYGYYLYVAGESRGIVLIGYQASHEQFPPSTLLGWARAAERAGFDFVNSSDHFHPWGVDNAASGYAWSWLGPVMEATALRCSVVTAPVQRYHPAVVAQAAATLDDMYPGRLTLALGSGQLLNEGITGDDWPPHSVRHARVREAASVIRRLWAGECVTHDGLVRVREARLFTLPPTPPQLYSAALSQPTAEDAGGWADGLLTTARPIDALRRLIDGFRASGGEGKPIAVKVDVAWGGDETASLEAARAEWRGNALGRRLSETLRTPEDFDEASSTVRAEDMRSSLLLGPPEDHLRWLDQMAALGVDRVIVHNVTRDHERFIEEYGNTVLKARS